VACDTLVLRLNVRVPIEKICSLTFSRHAKQRADYVLWMAAPAMREIEHRIKKQHITDGAISHTRTL